MSIRTPKIPANCLENQAKSHDDIVALKKFDFKNPRTWEVIESKGPERPFSGHGTWEDAENKAVVGNVRNRSFHDDKLPRCDADFCTDFRAAMGRLNTSCLPANSGPPSPAQPAVKHSGFASIAAAALPNEYFLFR